MEYPHMKMSRKGFIQTLFGGAVAFVAGKNIKAEEKVEEKLEEIQIRHGIKPASEFKYNTNAYGSATIVMCYSSECNSTAHYPFVTSYKDPRNWEDNK
jgi:hypothetical protein